jgi:hypothetical protein
MLLHDWHGQFSHFWQFSDYGCQPLEQLMGCVMRQECMVLREGTENNFRYYKFHYLETVSYCLLEHLHCFDYKLLFVC